MSLHSLANHLQSAGRGEDKVLVHMTPKEVNGLQSLAMAHGGSLTINPETGLPEAGFLKRLLPMIAGFALGPAGLGMTAMQAGLVSGAVGAATSGSLEKGLMAGLGAYSGAGLGAGLQSMANPAAAAGGQGLTLTNSGVALQNNGATVGLRASGAVPTAGVDMSTAGFKNPVFDSGFTNVSNAPLVSVGPANAAEFMNATNQSMLGKMGYTGPGSLPVAGAKPVPFSDIPASVDPRTLPGGALYTPDPGAANVANRAFQPQGKLVGEFPSPYHDAYTGGVKPTSTLNMPEGATGWGGSSASGYKYYGPGGDQIGTFPVKGNLTAAGAKYTPSTATTSQPFAGGMKHVPSTSTAVDVSEQSISRPFTDKMAELGRGAKASFGSLDGLKGLYAASEAAAPYGTYAGLGSAAYSMYEEKRKKMEDEARAREAANQGLIRPYTFDYGTGNVSSQPYSGSAERTYFQPTYTAGTPYKAPGPEYAAKGGLMGLAVGGAVEEMAAQNAVGANTGYPMANLQTPMYANPAMQRPEATNVIAPSVDAGVNTYTGEARFAKGGDTGPPDTRPFFNPNTTGKSAEDYYRSELAGGRRAPIAAPSAPVKYAYDPNTMQFTQTGGSKPTTVTGGVSTPTMQPPAPAQPLFNPVNIPAYQTPEQQLGLGGFYDYMNQQMGGLGGYGGFSGYAAGGIPRLKSAPMNTKMAAVDDAIQKMQTRKGKQEIEMAALNGDFTAQIALQRMAERESLNKLTSLGGYSDGGRLLKGPGDGVSDSIPASIGGRQPARLADGEFVVPARIVSEIGNGSTEAGARKLYAMMDRVQKARRRTVGKGQVAANTKAEKLLPA